MKKRFKGDKAAARELILFADNESSIYPQRVSIHKNLLKEIKAGKYSDTKAAKLWGYWFEAAAKSYARQMATPGEWSRIFSPSTRRLAARTYASREGRILRAAARGETQDYVYKNPRKKYSNSAAHRKEFKRLAREAMKDARRWAKDHGKDEKYLAIIRRAREWSRESFARKNPDFEDSNRPVLQPGSTARWDTSVGMIPCRVVSVSGSGAPGMQKVRFKLTANRGPYKKGEIHEDHGMRVVPRKAHFARHGARIGYYTVRENPSGVYLAAKRGSQTLYFKGGKFSSGKPGAKIFATGARAMEKATQLAKRFKVLSDYVLFPERVTSPK